MTLKFPLDNVVKMKTTLQLYQNNFAYYLWWEKPKEEEDLWWEFKFWKFIFCSKTKKHICDDGVKKMKEWVIRINI